MALLEDLRKLSEKIEIQLPRMRLTEQATIFASIHPFLRALGYDPNNLDEVEPEVVADAKTHGSKSVDIAVRRSGELIFILEAKSAKVALNEYHWEQLHNYFNSKEVRFGILTNGIEYRFFTDLRKSNIMDNAPFMTVDMLNLDERLVGDLADFSKTKFNAQRILDGARRLVIRRLIQKEIDNPSDTLVEHFASQVQTSAPASLELNKYRQIVKSAWKELAGRVDNVPVVPDPVVIDPHPITNDEFYAPIFASHNGQRFEATLLVDEIMNWHKKNIMIRFEGELLTHTEATLKAVRATNPTRKTGKSGLQFWRFNHPETGEVLPINVLCEDVRRGGSLRQQLQDKLKS